MLLSQLVEASRLPSLIEAGVEVRLVGPPEIRLVEAQFDTDSADGGPVHLVLADGEKIQVRREAQLHALVGSL